MYQTDSAAARVCAWCMRLHVPGVAGPVAVQRDLGGRRREVAQPRRGSAADFEDRRVEHYGALRKPLDPTEFIDELRERDAHRTGSPARRAAECDWLEIKERTPGPDQADADPPRSRSHATCAGLRPRSQTRWGVVPLIDILKETVLRTGCLSAVDLGRRPRHPAGEVLVERLLLAIYAYGTNTGIRAMAGGAHGHSEDDIRYARRRYLNAGGGTADRDRDRRTPPSRPAARRSWGAGLDRDRFGFDAFGASIRTSSPSALPLRPPRRAHLLDVEKGSVVIHSQLLNCSASEVRAMVDGAIHHGTEMAVEANYVDTHGQSEIGFGITKLLGFDLLPRIKRINEVKLYRPAAGEPDLWPGLKPAMTRPISWDQDRRAVRPDAQVRDRDPHRHRVDGGDPAAVHEG